MRLGSSLSVEGVLVLALPEEVNNIFGERDGRPLYPLLNRELRMGISVHSKRGLGFEPDSSMVNLEAAGIFRTEVEGDRSWTRLTLGALTFRFAEIPVRPRRGRSGGTSTSGSTGRWRS